MTQLLDLPNELLSVIASWLSEFDTKSHQAGLASLCLSCWRLNEIAQGKLYASPRLFLLRGSDPLRPWWTFARTALEDPRLAVKVQKLAFDASDYADAGEVPEVFFDVTRLGPVCPPYGELGPRFYATRLVGLLVKLAYRTRKLQLRLTSRLHWSIFQHFSIYDDYEGYPFFAELYEIEVSPIVSQHTGEPPLVRPESSILHSTRHRKLHFERVAFIHTITVPYLPTKTHSLVELYLHRCYIPFKVLRPWIVACRQLKVFSFSSHYSDGGHCARQNHSVHGVHQLTPRQLFPALHACTGTLERLNVDFGNVWELPQDPLEEPCVHYIYPSFQIFTQLRHLCTEIARVNQPEDFPPSLETLTLINNEMTEFSASDFEVLCLEFMDLVHAQCTNLKWIHVKQKDLSEAEIQSVLTRLEWLDETRHAEGLPRRSFEIRISAGG